MRLATISEEAGIGEDFKRAKPGMRPEIYDMQLEPGEYLVGRGTNYFLLQVSYGIVRIEMNSQSLWYANSLGKSTHVCETRKEEFIATETQGYNSNITCT